MPRGRKKKQPRRKPNTGTIRHKTGREKPYEAAFPLGHGQYRYASFVTSEEATEWLDGLTRERDTTQRNIAAGSQPVSQFFHTWIELKKALISPNTLQNYQYLCELAMTHIGTMRVDGVAREDAQAMLNALQKQKFKNMRHVRSLMRHIFEYAVQERYIDRNPFTYTQIAPPEPREIPVIDKDQRAAMLEAAATEDRMRYERHTVPLCPIWYLYSVLGLRRGEALGLQWSDFDEINRTLSIQRQITAVRNKALERKTKTKRATRTVPLPDDLYQLLQEHRKNSVSTYIFSQRDGSFITPDYIDSRWIKLRARCDVPRNLTIHDLRHAAAYILAMDGADDVIRMAILGHSGRDMATHYAGHASLADMRRALNKAS